MTKPSTLRRHGYATTALGLVLALGAAQAAQAQTSPPPANDAAEVEEVIVTGTSIRGVEAVGSQTLQVNRDSIISSGLSTPVDVIRTLPQVQGLGFDSTPRVAKTGGGNIQRGTAISLRGLQSNATLVLIDGHRIAPTGNVFSFTEANQLPVSAIERIEVVADGASAIYGSDAVAGVVNYIPRKSFDGIELSARYRTNDFFNEYGVAALAGTHWDQLGALGGGHIVAAIDYNDQGAMRRGASPYLRQDLRAFGGNDGRINGNAATSNTPGNIIVAGPRNTTLPSAGNFTYYGIPTSGPITAATLKLNQPNLLDSADYIDFMPSAERKQAYLFVDQEINDSLTVYFQGYYNKRESLLRTLAQSGLRTVPASSPNYITGVPGVAPGAPLSVSFTFLNSVGQTYQRISNTSTAATAGFRAKLPGDWRADVSFPDSLDRLCANCVEPLGANVNAVVLQQEINNGNVNPFGTAPIAAAELSKFLVAGYDQSRSILDDTLIKFDGPLFELPGGTLRAAVGAEFQEISGARTSRGIQATSDTIGAKANRSVKSYYAELFIPLVGEGNALPLVQSLNLDIAVRTESYSDFGDTTNPKIGATWEVNDDLEFRAAWGKSFRAPNLVESSPAFFSRVALTTIANAAGDPAVPVTNAATGQSNVVAVSGSNADLEPEKARNYSMGFTYKPSALEGLEISATYYNIEYTNQIIGLQTASGTFLATPANRALYSAYITPAVQPSTCVNGQPSTYNPAYLGPLARPTLTPIDQSNFCSSAAIIYTQNTNAATTEQDGVDLNASWRFETDYGRITPSFGGAKILNNRQALAPNAPLFDALGLINFPISLRYRAGVAWSHGPLTANLAANYVGEYRNNLPITVNGVAQAAADVPSWTTYDLSFSYMPASGSGWADGLRATVTLLNLFDKDPPTVLSANGGAFDQQSHNVFGRQVSLQLSKTF